MQGPKPYKDGSEGETEREDCQSGGSQLVGSERSGMNNA